MKCFKVLLFKKAFLTSNVFNLVAVKYVLVETKKDLLSYCVNWVNNFDCDTYRFIECDLKDITDCGVIML